MSMKKHCILALLLWVFHGGLLRAQALEWAARYNGPGNFMNDAKALAVDAEGHVYVTGESWGDGTRYDYATIKYDANGQPVWIARYNGPGNGNDRAQAIALDAGDNVYVTGTSTGMGTDSDYATIKYDANGRPLWVARYNGPGNDRDSATALAVDADGNVYVTGLSWGLGTGYDYATIKYDANGNQVWVARYHGPGNGHDAATALALDADGNVYVTGESLGAGTSSDYATIKYDADGNQVWVARYHGPGNGTNQARAVAVDVYGNVYVTGESAGAGTTTDYATIKYDPEGKQVWVARYHGPGNGDDAAQAIAADADGNVYVTGSSAGPVQLDYATIKYDVEGRPAWIARYNGPANHVDIARAMALDGEGNVYVTGESCTQVVISGPAHRRYCRKYNYATIKYDANGNEIWRALYDGKTMGFENEDPVVSLVPTPIREQPNALALDKEGSIYVTGGRSGWDYLTIKYSQ